MTQYRSFISLRLIVVQALLISGCYTYRSMTEDGQNEVVPNNEDAIRITLNDGSVIESPAFMHVDTHEPSDLIIGTGQERSTPRTFKGILTSGEIDSVKTIPTAGGEALLCWLKNRSSIAFKPHEYLRVSMQDPPGLWCAGKKTSLGGVSEFRGIVSREQLTDIEVEHLDGLKSAAVVAAPVLLAVLLYEIGYQIFVVADRNLPTGPR